jgi:SAM-dependent methyltransferase
MANSTPEQDRPPVCDYEGSDYQIRFWERGGRAYEDLCEAIALRRLLPRRGELMLELGAGAGRNTTRYTGFERIVLLDYSRTQLQQAQERLGRSDQYIYVAADIYRLPFRDSIFDAATMIRVLHHMADAPAALRQIRDALQPGAVFILEFANKRNLKSILRRLLGKQEWSPFDLQPVEFAPLNFDFHPRAVRTWLKELDLRIERVLTVSHFRIGFLKRNVPPRFLAALDSLLQWTGSLFQVSPSIFVRASLQKAGPGRAPFTAAVDLFKCPDCGSSELTDHGDRLTCCGCGKAWGTTGGIYNFKEPL